MFYACGGAGFGGSRRHRRFTNDAAPERTTVMQLS
jgi:hypothetical protein